MGEPSLNLPGCNGCIISIFEFSLGLTVSLSGGESVVPSRKLTYPRFPGGDDNQKDARFKKGKEQLPFKIPITDPWDERTVSLTYMNGWFLMVQYGRCM